jgi:hypothetical protein
LVHVGEIVAIEFDSDDEEKIDEIFVVEYTDGDREDMDKDEFAYARNFYKKARDEEDARPDMNSREDYTSSEKEESSVARVTLGSMNAEEQEAVSSAILRKTMALEEVGAIHEESEIATGTAC